ncbi:aldolase [Actinopolymorpha sp. NPDC004070]|uniref:Cgl0159 family (beta/alpha)8-fold protein n=1 Tax=Actinopolymorpha sp. NPDC004070 TaxID=3154548 RepID=UPI0033A9CBE6
MSAQTVAGTRTSAPVDVEALATRRFTDPDAIARAYATRRRRRLVGPSGRLMIVAADHPARGALGAGTRVLAMADRAELLGRLLVALERPGVDGVLAAPDVIEDLLLLGALDNKVVFGSMNRGGLPGAAFEVDDRFTAYDPSSIARYGLDAGKMLLRIDLADPGTATTLESCARAVSALAEQGRIALVEPFLSRRVDGRLTNDLGGEAVLRSAVIAAGLGTTSAYTWLKLPVVADAEEMERVAAATSLPVMLLGGEVAADPDAVYARWAKALTLPTVRGLVVGRSLLYPPGDDVAAAVDTAVSLLPADAPPTSATQAPAPTAPTAPTTPTDLEAS